MNSGGPQKTAEAAAKIQFAINLLHDGICAMLEKVLNEPSGLKKREDFNHCLKIIEKNVQKILPNLSDKDHLLMTLEHARRARNRYSHQNSDINRFEHDVECLVKIASLLGLTECREQIMEFTGSAGVSAEDWEKLKAEGNEHYKAGRWTEAMDCYTKAIRINPTVAALYSNRALCEIRLNKFELAREDAEDAIGIDPTQVKFYRTLSEALYNLDLYKEAVDACKEGLKVDPRDETLVVRVRDCQALVVDAEIKEHPVHGRVTGATNPELFQKLCNQAIHDFPSEISPDDISPVDTIKRENLLHVRKAHYILLAGRGNIIEEQKALKIFESAANRGSAEGMFNLAKMMLDGMAGLPRNPKKYLELCQKAAQQKPFLKMDGSDTILPNIGVAEAENSIAMAYREGLVFDQDDKLAFQWFLNSATHGCASAMNNLGIALYNGDGCEKNLKSARWWYEKSAELGQSEAQLNLAAMLIRGDGGPEDSSRAVELLRAAAEQGLPGALLSLQNLQRSGAVGAKSMRVSKTFVEKSAESNDKEALFLMGMNYMAGEGGYSQDLSEAEKYLRKASDLNHKEATYALGNLLLQQNKDEDAVLFIRKAAESGNEDAQKILGRLLALGHGCDRDTVQARRWLIRSKEKPSAADEFIKRSTEVVEYEAAQNLSIRGLSYLARIERFIESSIPSAGQVKQHFRDMQQIVQECRDQKLHPGRSGSPFDLFGSLPLMQERAAKGSKTAQKLFIGLDLIEKIRSSLQNNSISSAFRLFQQADKIWKPLLVDYVTLSSLYAAAMEAFNNDPKNADALFVILHYNIAHQVNNAELLHMAIQCTNLNPEVGEFHNMRACLHGFNGDHVASLRAIEQALEIEWYPDWLYNRGTALRLQKTKDRQLVIMGYLEYISSDEPDSRDIPKAWYCIAMEYFNMKDIKKAKEYFDKGLRAESPDVRLPCFGPIDDFPIKNMLKVALEAVTSMGHDLLPMQNQCGNCGSLGASSRCSKCKKIHYCGRECQLKHWKKHKKNCAA